MRDTRSLRPRSLLGIFDSATEIAVSSPQVAALAFLGAAPVTVLGVLLWYVASEGVPLPGGMAALALACGLATMWRFIPAGAASAMVMARLSGREVSVGEAMGEALRRAPLLLAAGSLTLAYWALCLPLLLVPMFFSGGAFMTAPMVVDGAGPPWRLAGQGRRLLGNRSAAPGGLSLLWVMGVLLLGANLAGLTGLMLMLARSLANLELGYLGTLLSPDNPVYLPALLGISFLLLEPVRLASVALLYVDAKSRREGADLQAALESLSVENRRSPGSHKSPALLVLVLAMAASGVASPALAKPADSLAAETRSGEAENLRQEILALEKRAESRGARSFEAMERLSRRLEEDLDQGRLDAARRRLEAAGEELDGVTPGDVHREVETRRVAREVLARREFRKVDPSAREKVEIKELSLLNRLLEFLDRRFGKRGRSSGAGSGSIAGEGLANFLWGLGLLAFLVLVVILVTRALAARRAREGEGDQEAPSKRTEAPTGKGALGIDPLSRTPSAWLAEADRLAALGAHRLALRAAYLALLSQLHRVRCIDYQPTRTNWDHARSFRGPEASGLIFTDLTRRFDRAWYGQRTIGAEEYRVVRSGALSLFEPEQGGAGA